MPRTKRSPRFSTLAVLLASLLATLAGCGSGGGNGSSATVQQLGAISSVLNERITGRVALAKSSAPNAAPILLQGETVSALGDREKEIVRAAYAAGRTIVLLDADMEHIAALHQLIGEGIAYASATEPTVMAYTLRRERNVPTATLLTNARPSPLGLDVDDSFALERAADIVVNELLYTPRSGPDDENKGDGPVAWQDNPQQTTTLAQNGYWGVYNTLVNIYALHACLDDTDRYVVTAEADWTPTRARFQSANLDDRPAWEDGSTYCRASIFPVVNLNQCRYINYPLFYRLDMTAPTTGKILQINASPGGTQGTTTSYSSGFNFSIGGTVNVAGPGISAGATWTNVETSTVPPLKIDVGNSDGTQNPFWKYEYCTDGQEATTCTNHVQTDGESFGCKAFKMGQPQNGQTPNGKFSNVVTSAYWQAGPDTRVNDTFDITVTFDAEIGNTSSDLFGNGTGASGSCNLLNCSCTTSTTSKSEKSVFTFKVPFPSTKCGS